MQTGPLVQGQGFQLNVGRGRFSVNRKIPVFLKNRFFGFAKLQIPKRQSQATLHAITAMFGRQFPASLFREVIVPDYIYIHKLTTYLKDLPLQSVSSKKNLQVVDLILFR